MTDSLSAIAAFCLHLPGMKLYLSPLLAQKKIRKRGNKDGAVRASWNLKVLGRCWKLDVLRVHPL